MTTMKILKKRTVMQKSLWISNLMIYKIELKKEIQSSMLMLISAKMAWKESSSMKVILLKDLLPSSVRSIISRMKCKKS